MSLRFEATNIWHPFEDGSASNSSRPAPDARTRTVPCGPIAKDKNAPSGIAMDVEAVRVGEVSLVAVSGADIRRSIRAAGNERVVQFDVLRRGLEDQMNR